MSRSRELVHPYNLPEREIAGDCIEVDPVEPLRKSKYSQHGVFSLEDRKTRGDQEPFGSRTPRSNVWNNDEKLSKALL